MISMISVSLPDINATTAMNSQDATNSVMSQDRFITTEAGLWIQWSSFVNFCRQLLLLMLWLLLLLLFWLLPQWLKSIKFSYLRLRHSISAPPMPLLLHDYLWMTSY
jgi:hypothetical protein